MPELVTVVVPTRNNERTIERCLQSVRSQSYQSIELIVVDNFSNDRTVEIANRYADLVLSAGPERSAQRNAGFAAGSGEWGIWVDSDIYLTDDAVKKAMKIADDEQADGVGLPERTIGEGFWTSCRALERECYLNVLQMHNPRLLRRLFLLDGGGGFDVRMSGPEDANLRINMREAGMKIVLAPVIIDHDEGRLTLRDIFDKRVYYGRSIPILEKEHPGAVLSQARYIATSYAKNWKLLARHPVRTPSMFGMRLMEAFGYFVGSWRARRNRTPA